MKMRQLLSYSCFLVLMTILLFACGNSQEGQAPANLLPATGYPEIDKLSAKIAEDPGNADLYARRAGLFYENEGYDEALQDLNKAISLDSTNVVYRHELANIYMDYNNSRMALYTMEETAKLFPDRIPTLLKLSEFQLIFRQYQDALKTLETIRQMDPLNAEMFYMAGLVFQELGKQDEAISNFQSAVENDPDILEAWVNLGKLWSVKNPTTAIHFFDNALRVDSTSLLALHEKAYYLSNVLNDLDGALEVYDRLIVHHPRYIDGYYNSGLLLMDMDSLKGANEKFSMALQIDPAAIQAYYYRGLTFEMMGQANRAIADYEQVLKFNPEDEAAQAGMERLKGAN
ncbi:MAG: tetratricopeptide repeat protein [Phaeodactylibacter sp.]|nr:tetratricopeptide repeat protein [Phaeodactylibacter sp.]